MKIRNRAYRCAALLLVVSLVLSMAACSGQNTTAATMHLRRAEGTVSVSGGDGKDVPVLEKLGLYSGYGVNTRSESYAWIDLDDVKLTKLDQNSEIAIQKEGKKLDIEVKSGSLFFNVTQPLEDDETMNIRTSTMLVGIRGTCGWVEHRDGLSRVYILEGKVSCSAGDQSVRIYAGEMAELTADGKIAVSTFTIRDMLDWETAYDHIMNYTDRQVSQAEYEQALAAFGIDEATNMRLTQDDIHNITPDEVSQVFAGPA